MGRTRRSNGTSRIGRRRTTPQGLPSEPDAKLSTPPAAKFTGPAEMSGLIERAYALVQEGEGGRALDVLDRGIVGAPQTAEAWRAKALVHAFQGESEHARQAYDRLIALTPDSAEGWLGKGQSLLNDGDAGQALDCADEVVKLDARSAQGHALRGDSLMRLERWNEAFDAFFAAAKCD